MLSSRIYIILIQQAYSENVFQNLYTAFGRDAEHRRDIIVQSSTYMDY